MTIDPEASENVISELMAPQHPTTPSSGIRAALRYTASDGATMPNRSEKVHVADVRQPLMGVSHASVSLGIGSRPLDDSEGGRTLTARLCAQPERARSRPQAESEQERKPLEMIVRTEAPSASRWRRSRGDGIALLRKASRTPRSLERGGSFGTAARGSSFEGTLLTRLSFGRTPVPRAPWP